MEDNTICKSISFVLDLNDVYFRAPETLQNQRYTEKSDMWALGCTLYELCMLQPAFQGDEVFDAKNQKRYFQWPPHLSNRYTKDVQKVASQLLEVDPAKRPSSAEFIRSAGIQKYLRRVIDRYHLDSKQNFLHLLAAVVHHPVELRVTQDEKATPEKLASRGSDRCVKSSASKTAHEGEVRSHYEDATIVYWPKKPQIFFAYLPILFICSFSTLFFHRFIPVEIRENLYRRQIFGILQQRQFRRIQS